MSKIKANEISNLAGDAPPAITGGYTYVTTLYYTSPGTHQFVKANYPWLRGIRVIAQGGGGGGSGAAADMWCVGCGGGGGGCAIKWLDEAAIAALPSSASVVVGAGGQGGPATDNPAGNGGHSSFAGVVIGYGGDGGRRISEIGDVWGGQGSGGDIIIPGGCGRSPSRVNGCPSGTGGDSYLGAGARMNPVQGAGSAGRGYGGGGSGGFRITNSYGGGPGAAGCVILELYA